MGAQGSVLARWRSFRRRKRHESTALAEGRRDDATVTAQNPDSRGGGGYARSVAPRRGTGYSIDPHADGNERADDRIIVVQPNGAVLRPGPDDIAHFRVTGTVRGLYLKLPTPPTPTTQKDSQRVSIGRTNERTSDGAGAS
jgi:hypothetical protein